MVEEKVLPNNEEYVVSIADQTFAALIGAFLDTAERGGFKRPTRPGVNTIVSLGTSLTLPNIADHFPIVGLKKTFFHSALVEILWMLRGETTVDWLHENGVTIWDSWVRPDGSFGPIYGKQWRAWETKDGGTIDQLQRLADGLASNPYGRRHLMTTWNPGDLDDMALPPCHGCPVQFIATAMEGGDWILHTTMYQRSADLMIGVPFNWAHYAILTFVLCSYLREKTGVVWTPGNLNISYGDLHLYENHLEGARRVLDRFIAWGPAQESESPVRLKVGRFKTLEPAEFTVDKFELIDYKPLGHIKLPINV